MIVPIRYLSDDGHCAVDVALKHGIRGDVSSGFAVARATGRVFQQCLAAARDGYTSGFSKCKSRSSSYFQRIRCVIFASRDNQNTR